MRPGPMVFTRMPSGASSMARLFARPDIAARKVLERMRFSMGCLMDEDAMLTMRPPPRSRIRGSAPRTARMRLNKTSSNPACQPSSSKSSKVPAGGPLVLFEPSRVTRPLNGGGWGTVGDDVIGPLGRQQLGDVPLETPGDAGVAVAVDLHGQPALRRSVAHLPYCVFFAVAWCCNFRKCS